MRRKGRVIDCIAAAGSALAPGKAAVLSARWQLPRHSAASSTHAMDWNRPARTVDGDMRTLFP
ncbi:hypothetical protein XPN_1599 [Xanthomonas arboricola pv. pruni MAFF 301427]|nr:hypothetical protein XPN_1599 [Xanthomonas arboricola pv. pruni MAFF 301427]